MASVETLMKNLGITKEQALEVIEYDKAVDKMSVAEINASYSAEERKIIKAMSGTGTRKKNGEKVAKIVKNEQKSGIIAQLFAFLSENITENAEITNETRSISFKIGEKSYDLTLIEHRTPKK